MSAQSVAWGLVLASILASAIGYGEVGLFLVIAAVIVAVANIPHGARRDARRRNRQ